MSEKSFTVTEGRLRAMAKECPEVEKALKKGFPEAFESEEKFTEKEVDGMINEILIRCKAVSCIGSGSFVADKAVMSRNRYLIFRILSGGVRAMWLDKKENKKLYDWLSEENTRKYKEGK